MDLFWRVFILVVNPVFGKVNLLVLISADLPLLYSFSHKTFPSFVFSHSLFLFSPPSFCPFSLQEPQTTVIHNPVDGTKVHPAPLLPSPCPSFIILIFTLLLHACSNSCRVYWTCLCFVCLCMGDIMCVCVFLLCAAALWAVVFPLADDSMTDSLWWMLSLCMGCVAVVW